MTEGLVSDVATLMRRADSTPGARVDAEPHLVGLSLNLFTLNAAELAVRLDDEERPEEFLTSGPNNRIEVERRLDEIDRLLHASPTPPEHV